MTTTTRTNHERDIPEARTKVKLPLIIPTRQNKAHAKRMKDKAKSKAEAKIIRDKLSGMKPSKGNYPEFQGKLNVITAIEQKAIQIRKAIEHDFKVVIPAIDVNYFDTKMKIIAISEDGFKVDGNQNVLEYVWLDKKELNKVLQTLQRIKLPRFGEVPVISDKGEVTGFEVVKK